MRCKYREKIYRCGEYLEVDVFPVYAKASGRRKAKYKPTSAMQERLNQRNAEKALTRLLNENFNEYDISLTLTYDDKYLPETFEEASRDVDNFLRRLRRLRKKLGLAELKYVRIPGPGRIHFHIPMSGGIDDKTLQKLWPYGYANAIHFEFNENGIEGHAHYIAKQFEEDNYSGEDLLSLLDIDEETGEVMGEVSEKRRKNKKRYTCSKNIIRPQPEERDGRISAARVEEIATIDSSSRSVFEKMYPGYCFVSCQPYYNSENGGYYLQVKMYKTDASWLKRNSRYKARKRSNT